MGLDWKKAVKKGYDGGFYNVGDVYHFYYKKRITADDFYEITGVTIVDYEENLKQETTE